MHSSYHYCANCSHRWQWEEGPSQSALRFCTPQCQVCYYVLGAKQKLGDSQMDDIMQIRVPKKTVKWDQSLKDLKAEEKKAVVSAIQENKRQVTRHWIAIYLEFMEYYDEFVSNELVKLGARFDDVTDVKPRSQTKKQLVARSRRLLLAGLDDHPDIYALVENREQLDALFRHGGQLELLDRENDVMATTKIDTYAKVEENMRLLRDNTTQLDKLLAKRVPNYEKARDRFLLLMQSMDFRDHIGGELYMKQWNGEITRLDQEVRTGRGDEQTIEQNQQRLKDRLIVAYKLAPYYEKLAKVIDKYPLVRDEVHKMHQELIDLLDKGSLEFEQHLRECIRQLDELVKEYPQKKEKKSKKSEKSEKSSKSNKSEKEKTKGKATKIRKEDTKRKKAKPPKQRVDDDDMVIIQPVNNNTNNNTNDGMPPLTVDEMMQVDPPRYENDELAERTTLSAQWHANAQRDPAMSQSRKEIIRNLHNYYADLRDQGRY